MVCDGKTRSVAVTVLVGMFDVGRPFAEASLKPSFGPATAKCGITVVEA